MQCSTENYCITVHYSSVQCSYLFLDLRERWCSDNRIRGRNTLWEPREEGRRGDGGEVQVGGRTGGEAQAKSGEEVEAQVGTGGETLVASGGEGEALVGAGGEAQI